MSAPGILVVGDETLAIALGESHISQKAPSEVDGDGCSFDFVSTADSPQRASTWENCDLV